MSKTVLVLAVPHQLQGPKFLGFVADPSYNLLVKSAVLRRGVNFIFEEASGLGPSVAEEIARTLLGPGHYMDIDPSREEREKYGIAKETGEGNPIDPFNSSDVYYCLFLNEQMKREELWLRRIQQQDFATGLVIIGLAHNLSFAFRLGSAGIGAEPFNYIPYGKL